MFPAGIYYVQTRGLPCLYEQTCLSNSVCPLYVQTRGCASSVRAGFSLLTGSVYIYVLIQKTICNRGVCLSLIQRNNEDVVEYSPLVFIYAF